MDIILIIRVSDFVSVFVNRVNIWLFCDNPRSNSIEVIDFHRRVRVAITVDIPCVMKYDRP